MSGSPPESGQPAGGAASSVLTMLKALLREKNVQHYGLFKRADEKAAKELDSSFAGTYPSEKTFRRWMSGQVKDLPRAEHCVVLEVMLPGWRTVDLLKPYLAPGDVDGSTLLTELLRRRHLQTYRAFCKAYNTAAALIDEKLVGTFPAERQFCCWISGDMVGLPYPDHCNVLEAMFPGYSARQLFDISDDAGELGVVDDSRRQASEDFGLPELWELQEADELPFLDDEFGTLDRRGGVAVPARTPDGRIVLVTVPRRLFVGGMGAMAFGTALAPEVAPALDISPVEHFRKMRRALIDSDNLFGPAGVISATQEQIKIMRRLGEGWRGVDRRELLHVQAQFAELCSWFHEDSGDVHAAQYWLNRALEWSHMSRNHESIAFILARKSHLAGELAKPAEALDAAEAALDAADPGSRMAALALTFAGHGYALTRDKAGCERAYAQAQDLLQDADVNPESTRALNYFDSSYVAVHRARSLACLGEYQAATEIFQTAIAATAPGYRRDRGVYLAREASAHAGNEDAEQAATVGLQALAIGADTGSARIIRELSSLDDALTRWRSSPSVIEFRDALTSTLPRRAVQKDAE